MATVRPAARAEAAGGKATTAGIVVAAVAVALVVAAHVALAAPLRVPVIHPDELGYVQNARYLARGGLRPTTEYYPGYSLLLVPLWWLSRDPLTVWRGALVVNAALAGATVVLAWRLFGHLAPHLDRRWRALIVATTVAYPALVLFSDFSMSESAFAAGFLGVCILAARAAASSDAAGTVPWAPWAAVGVAGGLLALVHPRGYAVYVALALLGTALLVPKWRAARAALAALAGGLVAGFAVTRVLVVALKDPKSRFSSYSPGGIVSRAASLHGMLGLLSEAGGQMFYLSVATAGLVPFGLWVAGRSAVAFARGDRRAAVTARAFTGVAFAGVWAVSSLFINLGTRADKLIYGRYDDAAIAPLLMIALAEIVRPLDGRRRGALATWAAVGGVVLAGSAAFVGLGHPGSEIHGPLNPVNVIAIVPYIRHFDNRVEVLALLAVGLLSLGGLAVLSVRVPALAIGVLAVVFIASSLRTQATYIVPGSRSRAQQNAVPLALEALRAHAGVPLGCVAWDNPLADDFALYNTEFLVPEQQIRPFGGPAGPPCGPLVVSPKASFATRYPGARLITDDPYAQVALWALPATPIEPVLAAGGWLFPAGPPAPLDDAERSGPITAPASVSVRSGGLLRLPLVVSHPAGGAPWPTLFTFPNGQYAVRISLEWESASGSGAAAGCPPIAGAVADPLACPAVDLPHVMLPATSAVVRAIVRAESSSGAPLPPGVYTLRVGLFQQLVGGFSTSTTVEVHVTG